jgi:hypothetical protein
LDPAHEVAALRAEVEMLRHQLAEAQRAQPSVPTAAAPLPESTSASRKAAKE